MTLNEILITHYYIQIQLLIVIIINHSFVNVVVFLLILPGNTLIIRTLLEHNDHY